MCPASGLVHPALHTFFILIHTTFPSSLFVSGKASNHHRSPSAPAPANRLGNNITSSASDQQPNYGNQYNYAAPRMANNDLGQRKVVFNGMPMVAKYNTPKGLYSEENYEQAWDQINGFAGSGR